MGSSKRIEGKHHYFEHILNADRLESQKSKHEQHEKMLKQIQFSTFDNLDFLILAGSIQFLFHVFPPSPPICYKTHPSTHRLDQEQPTSDDTLGRVHTDSDHKNDGGVAGQPSSGSGTSLFSYSTYRFHPDLIIFYLEFPLDLDLPHVCTVTIVIGFQGYM